MSGTNHRRRLLAAVLAASAALAVVAAVTPPAGDADAQAGVPREHRVAVFADSVGLGARHSIPAAFPADWEVNVVGEPARFVEQLESGPCFWTLTNQRCDVRFRLSSNPEWFGDHVVIAAGYNYPYWDPDRFDRSIDSMVETLVAAGVKHVYWVTLREVKPQFVSGSAWRQVQPYYWYFPTVNAHLERALARHPELTLIDWAAVADRPGITYDAIHLNNDGAALYAEHIRASVMRTMTKVADGSTTRIPIPDPTGVTAVAVNLTTTQPRHRGFLTAYDCDRPRPDVSSHNYVREQTVAHATVVPVGPSGEICVYASTATNLIVDLTGTFTGSLSTSDSTRLLDTRPGGRRQAAFEPIVVDVGTTDTAAFTITAIGADVRSWVRVAPCGESDETSNVNMNGPDPVPNAAVVRPGADGTVCVVTSTPAHLILDRLATFSDETGLTVEPARRVVDTRTGTRVVAGGTLRISAADLGTGPGSGVTGVLLNLTGTRSGAGFVTAFGCDDGEPETSSLNLAPGQVAANFVVIAPDADGDICLRTTTTTDLIVDAQGTVGVGFAGTADRLLDTRN